MEEYEMAASAVSETIDVFLVGDFGVGKTTIFTCFKTSCTDDTVWTREEIERECTKDLAVDGKKVSVTLHKTAGMEIHDGKTYYPRYFGVVVVIFVYSITCSESINSIRNWESSIPEYMVFGDETILVLCGNKSDQEEVREVSRHRAITVAQNHEIDKQLVFEICALNGSGFEIMFAKIIRAVRKTGIEQDSDTIVLGTDTSNGKGGGSCSKK